MSKLNNETISSTEEIKKEFDELSYSELLNKEFEKSGSNTRITKIPDDKKPTAKSLQQLSREIEAGAKMISRSKGIF